MPNIPRNVSARELVKALSKHGYVITRQTGSHIRLTTNINGEHHITIPDHTPLKIGTLNNILKEVAAYLGRNKQDIIDELWK